MIYCKKCGKERLPLYKACQNCGSKEYSTTAPSKVPNHPIITERFCPKCGDERSTVKVGVRGEYDGYILPVFLAHPDLKLIVKDEMISGLLALICNNCGFTEFYAEKPKNVLVKRPDKPVEE